MAMTHLVPGNRTTPKYLARRAFGSGANYMPCLAQSFPDAREALGETPTTRQQVASFTWFLADRIAHGRIDFLEVDFANLLGLACGRLAVDGRSDHWTFKLARRLGFA